MQQYCLAGKNVTSTKLEYEMDHGYNCDKYSYVHVIVRINLHDDRV